VSKCELEDIDIENVQTTFPRKNYCQNMSKTQNVREDIDIEKQLQTTLARAVLMYRKDWNDPQK
jgi:hypothetical protein